MLSDLQTDCRLRVNRVNLIVRRSLPVYPKQRTSPDRLGWSGWCQQRKSRLFDHFVANGRALLRWSFGQPGLPQSFFISREIVGPPRAQHGFKSGNT
jgi:hypothetical protein